MRCGLRGRGEVFAAAAVFVIVLAPLLQLRYGYQAGTNDHLVLSLQGLQWGRPGFLANDWFVASAPQPHVLFDLATWAGAATGRLVEVYVAWWLLGLVAGGLATAVLARAWTPGHPLLASAVVAALIGLGPEIVLGSTSPALPTALPQELGGFLGYLSAALLLTRQPRAAGVAIAATAVVHVQVGALVAVTGILAVAGVAVLERQWWWPVLAGASVAGAVVAVVLRLRPVAAQSDDFVEICREVIPYHCDATTWSVSQLASGCAVVLAALLSVAYVAGSGRTAVALWGATVLAPALGLILGVLANRYGVPVAGRLAQTTNIFRLSVLVVPFGAWGLYVGFARLSGWRRLAWLLPAVVAGYGWLVPNAGTPALPETPYWAWAVLAVASVGVLLRALPAPAGAAAGTAAGAAALVVLAVGAVDVGALRLRPVDLAFVPGRGDRDVGRLVAAHVPVGQEVLVPPTLGVVRLTSGRSILVDCKAVPYGGSAWRDYRERLRALGGRDSCHSGGRPFLEVSPEALTATATRYGARYLLLTARDPRAVPIQRLGWRALARPSARAVEVPQAGRTVQADAVWLFAAPGAQDAETPS